MIKRMMRGDIGEILILKDFRLPKERITHLVFHKMLVIPSLWQTLKNFHIEKDCNNSVNWLFNV